METADAESVKAKIFQEYNKDGMLETMLGYGLLMGGLSLAFRGNPAFTVMTVCWLGIFGKAWRRKITYPRLGYAQILGEHNRKVRMRGLVLFILAPLVIALIVLGAMASGVTVDQFGFLSPPSSKLIWGGIVALIVAGVAAIRKMKHLYLFAALAYLGCVVSYMLHTTAGYALVATGGLLLCLGIIRLILFLRANPRLDTEVADEPIH